MVVPYHNNYHDTTNFSDSCFRMTLTVGVEQTVTVPGVATNSYQALFGYPINASVLVGYNATAAVPADDTVVDSGRVEVNPIKRFVKGGDVLHFVTSDATARVGVSFRLLPE